MSKLSEIIDLFTKLALQLDSPISTSAVDEKSIECSISSLSCSLNPGNASDHPVLDTALSLMCFKAPQVFNLTVEYLVRTVVRVLSSSVDCKVLKILEQEETLQIGNAISRSDCFKLLDACGNLLEKLERRERLSLDLLHAVVRASSFAGCFLQSLPHISAIDQKTTGSHPLISRLHVPEKLILEERGIQLRLFTWYIDPLLLRRDVLKIMSDAKDRPFLCLRDEFHRREEWRCVIRCLVLSPAMLMATRSLLHKWFLTTGQTSILFFQTHLLSTILDVLSRPAWWGMSMDVSSKLPFLHAYFVCNVHILRHLAGPIFLGTFASLVSMVEKALSHSERCINPEIKKTPMAAIACPYSMWALATNFPEWSLFASCLLFWHQASQDNYQPKGPLPMALSEHSRLGCSTPSSTLAAHFLSWILCPIDHSHHKMLSDWLVDISGSWTNQVTVGSSKNGKEKQRKFRLNKGHASEKNVPDNSMLAQWLKEFHDGFIKAVGVCHSQSSLFSSVPLGIFLMYLNHINDDACGLLLHYAATTQIDPGHIGERKDAIAGACLVFRLTDIVETMSCSIFDTEEKAKDFICTVKGKVKKYLVMCVKSLIREQIDDMNFSIQTVRDLHSRYVRWKKLGGDDLLERIDQDDDVIIALEQKVSISC